MITRIWRGWTRPEDTEAYAAYIKATGIVAYKATPGNQGAYLISRPDGDRTEFLTVSFWDSLESIAAFAGDDIDKAVFYAEDDRFLIDRETTVTHFEVH
jgi:heme-degrading monooxygenase HmoA